MTITKIPKASKSTHSRLPAKASKYPLTKRRTITAVDLFCGAGGMSSGLLDACLALNLDCNLMAINHWQTAVDTHTLNHPLARHLCEDISNVNPRKIFPEGGVNILLGGPSCVSHSSARGGRPLDCDQDRATPWCVIRWAESTLPEIIVIENVPQFEKWGPLIRRRCQAKINVPTTSFRKWKAGQKEKGGAITRELWKRKVKMEKKVVGKMQWIPDKKREGETFHAWIKCLEALGYRVEWRVLCAADYGDPTTRKRLFIQAVRTPRKPCWPNQTHHENPAEAFDDLFARELRPWVPTLDIVDKSLKGRSVFNRDQDLVDKTMRRVWIGFKKFSLPKIIEAERLRMENTPEASFIVPNFGERENQEPRCHSTAKPLPTVTGHGAGALVNTEVTQKYIIKYKGTGTAEDALKPISTLQTSGKHHALAEVETHALPEMELQEEFVVRYHGQSTAESIKKPMSTVEAKGQKHYHAQSKAIRTGFVTELAYGEKNPNGEEHRNRGLEKPLGAVTGSNNWALTEGEFREADPFLIQVAHGNTRPSDDDRRAKTANAPMPSLTASPEWALGEAEVIPTEGYLLHVNHADTPGSSHERVKSLESTFPTVCGNRGEVALAQPEISFPAFVAIIDNQGKSGTQPAGGVRPVKKPISTITSKARHALLDGVATPKAHSKNALPQEVTFFRGDNNKIESFNPDQDGLPKKGKFYVMVFQTLFEVDIKLRMFEPHELSLAQGFPKGYKFTGNKTEQVRQIGNAVPRRTVRAIVLSSYSQNPEIPYLDEELAH